MMSRRIMANLVAFLMVAVLLIGYGMFSLLGNPFEANDKLYATFPDASGLRADFIVSMKGVVVGTVTDLDLVDDGVRVTMELDPGRSVPSDVTAEVIRASAIGEQRVELVPQDGGTGDPLPDGAEVPVADPSSPPEISEVLDSFIGLVEAIPAEPLNVVLDQTANALRGRSDDLRTLIRAGDAFNEAFLAREDAFRQLLDAGPAVADAFADAAPELRSTLENLRVISQVLADRRFDVVDLLVHGADLGEVGGALLTASRANLACFTSDVADLTRWLSSPVPLSNFEAGLDLNQQFFGPIPKLAVKGPVTAVPELGVPDLDNQAWLRVRTLMPPAQPAAEQYVPIRPTPDTKPGAACINQFGAGVPPASQSPLPPPGSRGGFDFPTSDDATTSPGPDADLSGIELAAAAGSESTAAGTGEMFVPVAVVGLALVVVVAQVGGPAPTTPVRRRRSRRSRR